MIIFAWKVNNPLSLLISRRASESFKSLFFFQRHSSLSWSWAKHTQSSCYFLVCSTLITVRLPSPTQRRHHAVPRHVLTRLPQQAVSHPSQNNLLQEDADGKRGTKTKKKNKTQTLTASHLHQVGKKHPVQVSHRCDSSAPRWWSTTASPLTKRTTSSVPRWTTWWSPTKASWGSRPPPVASQVPLHLRSGQFEGRRKKTKWLQLLFAHANWPVKEAQGDIFLKLLVLVLFPKWVFLLFSSF